MDGLVLSREILGEKCKDKTDVSRCYRIMATIIRVGMHAGIITLCFTSYHLINLCRQDCLNLGGDLVSIHSGRENGLLLGLMNGGQDVRPAWIGVAVCNDTSGCSEFSWTDGSPVPYANFYSGEASRPVAFYPFFTRSTLQPRVLLCHGGHC